MEKIANVEKIVISFFEKFGKYFLKISPIKTTDITKHKTPVNSNNIGTNSGLKSSFVKTSLIDQLAK